MADAPETDADLLDRLGTDGELWAHEFLSVWRCQKDSITDQSWLTGWFANAIEAGRAAAPSAYVVAAQRAEPIPMLLICPGCNSRHIDEGEFETKPHHTHACQFCGTVWRPAKVDTVGVRFLPGYKNDERTA